MVVVMKLASGPLQRAFSSSARVRAAAVPHSPAQANSFSNFGVPFSKVFLGGVFAFQFIYWSWNKLEFEQYKAETTGEMMCLEQTARKLASQEKANQ